MFDKELAELTAQYAVPDEQNAALEYDEIFKNLDVDSNQPEFYCSSSPSSKDEPWLSKDHPRTAQWLKSHRRTIEKLLQAAEKDKCIFLPITADPYSFGDNLNRLPDVRKCVFLLTSVANNDIAEGQIDDAFDKYFCIIKMAQHLYQQPTMIHHLVGFGIESLALDQLNCFVIEGQPSSEQLLLISDSMIGVENKWSTFWYKIINFEKLYAKNGFVCINYEVNTKGKIRYSRNSFAAFPADIRQNPKTVPYWKKRLNKADAISSWFSLPPSPQKISDMFDAGFKKYYAMAEPDFDWDKIPDEMKMPRKANYGAIIEMLTGIMEPAYKKVHNTYLKNLSLRRGSRLLIAIKQYHIEHGTWPDSLNAVKSNVPADALIDPTTGKEFEYENHGQHFSLSAESVNIWPK
jgi:hypothetical protein